jgi:phosphate transport system protein
MRPFDQLLNDVKTLLLVMGNRVEVAIDKAVTSLATENVPLAEVVIKDDQKIDEIEVQIDDMVMKLIATQQPVANDLRNLIATIKIASDLERMADLAVNIAKVTVEFKKNNHQLFNELKNIQEMAKITQQMVHDGMNSYIDSNIEMAKSLAKMDDQVDKIYEDIIRKLGNHLPHNNANVEVALKLCFVARYLERIADHTTNIAESIVYIVTGKQTDLN